MEALVAFLVVMIVIAIFIVAGFLYVQFAINEIKFDHITKWMQAAEERQKTTEEVVSKIIANQRKEQVK
jgi:hypothetical protein